MTHLPVLALVPGQGKRLRAGSPWVFSNEIVMRPEYRQMEKGSLVRLAMEDGAGFGVFTFNPHSVLAARLLDREPDAAIDHAWMFRRLEAAARLRARLCDPRFHRLVNAEADGLPGLIVDRYDDLVQVRSLTAGMDRLLPLVVSALRALLPLRVIVARNDAPARQQEGLQNDVRVLLGSAEDAVTIVEEGGVRFGIDLTDTRKTEWFYDQRANRERVASLAHGARVLDVFAHGGAFGLRCAAAGAESVTLVDSSAPALNQARDTALANGLITDIALRREDAFDALGLLAGTERRFDIVICDPPPLVSARKDMDVGLRAYGRMARLAATLVAPGGFLFTACRSQLVTAESWAGHIAYGLHRARRDGRIVWHGGAGPDHPAHPHLPELSGLKAMLLQIT